jgi:iron complex outermembrane receptor protein
MSRNTQSGLVLALLCAAAACQQSIAADARISFDLEAQPLEAALTRVGNIAKLNLLFNSTDLQGLQAPRLRANLDVEGALMRILAGTGLHVVHVNQHTISIVSDESLSAGSSVLSSQTSMQPPRSNVRLRYVGSVANSPDNTYLSDSGGESESDGTQSADRSRDLQEVLVTAEKRVERIQDVPVPVTVVSAQALVDTNQTRLQDYFSSIPGLNLSMSGFGHPSLFIRGITTGAATNPTIAVTVDDVTYSSATEAGGGDVFPDLDPSDLQRIEVLRGPQGTLYGAASLGGLVKFVTVDPSMTETSGRVQADASTIYNGSGAGYAFRGAVNVPINDTLAVRASGYTRHDPGYIDDVLTGVRGVNRENGSGGHLAALWKPSDDLSLKLSALVQHSSRYGWPEIGVGPSFGDLQQSVWYKVGGSDAKYQIYSAVLKAKLGLFDLTSITSDSINASYQSQDFTPAFSGFVEFGVPGSGFNGFGVPGVPLLETGSTNKFTQEVRANAALGTYVDWLVGLFYTHEKSSSGTENILATDSQGHVYGSAGVVSPRSIFEEYATFTNLTFHITDQLDLQLGGREGFNRQITSETDIGPYATIFEGGSPYVYPKITSDANDFTYLVTPEFKVSPDLMIYSRIASGYRPGGPNALPTFVAALDHYAPDKTTNYEIGTKGNVWANVISFDASVYHIVWNDIQLFAVDQATSLGYYTNGSKAKSDGVELSIQAHPIEGLSVSAWSSWNNAVLTRTIPKESTLYGLPGDRLPVSAKFTGNFSVEQEFHLTSELRGLAGAAVSYVGDRQGGLAANATTARPSMPAYAKTDLRLALTYGEWGATLYGNNITDRRGIISADAPVRGVSIIQPRTIGLSAYRKF